MHATAPGVSKPGWRRASRLSRVRGVSFATVLAGVAAGLSFLWLVLYLFVYLDRGLALVGYPFSIDQGEGYDVYSGWAIHLGQWIYTDNSQFPYYSSNYPPLYSYLISIPMAWLGPSLGLARAVSVLAALSTAAVIAEAVRRTSRSWFGAAWAGLFLLASPYAYHSTPLARVNALTLLLAVAALTVLERVRGRQVVVAGLLMLSALYTKQTSLDAFVAACAFLLLRRRTRDLAVFGLTVIVPGLGLLVGLEILSGGHFLANVVAGNANPWQLDQAAAYYSDFLVLHVAVLGLALLQTLRESRSGGPTLFGLYFGASCLLALTAGKWGAGESYFLAPLAAGCVQAGRFIGSIPARRRISAALGLALLAQAAIIVHGPLSDPLGVPERGFQAEALGWRPSADDRAAAKRVLEYVQRSRGEVLLEDPAFALAAERPVIGNATHLRNLWQAGLWQPRQMVADLEARRFDVILLEAELFPPPALAAIGRNYYLHEDIRVNGRRYLVFLPGSP